VTGADSLYLRGVAKIDERLVLLLDLARLLSGHEALAA
jgi:chemotaxis signal transduction protein